MMNEADKPNFENVQPKEAMRVIEAMVETDMQSYMDPKTGLLKSEIQVPVSECPCCGLNIKNSEKIFKRYVFEYFRCKECQHVYVAPRLNDDLTNKLYNEGRCLYQLKNFYLPSAEYRQKTIYTRKLGEIESVTKKGNLLDFGSSSGYFLDAATKRGWQAYGVELNKTAVQWSKDKLGLKNVFDKPLNECGFKKEMFDVITLWDVIEHIAEPLPILKELNSYLRPNGLIIVETSHYDCFETAALKEKNTNIVGDMHIMHFSIKSLSKLMERAGFVVKDVTTFGLDLKHILDYERKYNLSNFKIPEENLTVLQECIDKAGMGCYVKAIATK